MKRLFSFSFLFFCLYLGSFSQTNAGMDTGSHFTIGALDKMGKLDLTRIYIEEVHKLNVLLPYVPFNQKGDAISLSGMGIPDTKTNNESIKSLDSSAGGYNETIDTTLNTIVPYADKEDIIKAILFLQDIIERIEVGL